MTYEEHIDYIIEHTQKCITAYTYFCEYHWSLRVCAKNLQCSHTQVKNLLEDLANIDDDMYQSYLTELKVRNKKKAGWSH